MHHEGLTHSNAPRVASAPLLPATASFPTACVPARDGHTSSAYPTSCDIFTQFHTLLRSGLHNEV